ncbi:MAG: zinc-dependent alcohol dehydrogenase, partial [Terriglobia bacterium]
MKAILVTEPMKYGLAMVPQPPCGSGQVLIRTAYCGICGTDLEILGGTMPRGYVRYPLVPGHEWTGTIVQTGQDVSRCAVGDRVSVEGYLSCGACRHCHAGETNLCDSREQIGLTHNGGFAEYVVAPAGSCHPLPEHIGLEEALLVEPAATIVRGISRINLTPGFSATVVGCGPIGQITIRVLSLYQPSKLLAIDRSELQRFLAIQAGATTFVRTLDAGELLRESSAEGC